MSKSKFTVTHKPSTSRLAEGPRMGPSQVNFIWDMCQPVVLPVVRSAAKRVGLSFEEGLSLAFLRCQKWLSRQPVFAPQEVRLYESWLRDQIAKASLSALLDEGRSTLSRSGVTRQVRKGAALLTPFVGAMEGADLARKGVELGMTPEMAARAADEATGVRRARVFVPLHEDGGAPVQGLSAALSTPPRALRERASEEQEQEALLEALLSRVKPSTRKAAEAFLAKGGAGKAQPPASVVKALTLAAGDLRRTL